MENIVKDNIQFLLDALPPTEEADTNLYHAIHCLRIILKDPANIHRRRDAGDELGRFADSIRLNQKQLPVAEVCAKLDVALPCVDILEAVAYIQGVLFFTVTPEKVKKSVIKFQSQKIEDAKKKLAKA